MAVIPRLTPVEYFAESTPWFEALRHLPHPVWLDSGRPGSPYGRYDILAADPIKLLSTRGQYTRITHADGRITDSSENPFDLLRSQMPALADTCDLPFCGGALGYFGYDLGRRLENLPTLAVQDIELPDLQAGIYLWTIVQDHERQASWLVELPGLDEPARHRQKSAFHDLKQNIKRKGNSFKISSFHNELNANLYANSLEKIQAYIRDGDCYQVNFAQRFSATYEGDPFAAYLALRKSLPSPFSGYLETEQGAVLSLSPERFIQVRQGTAQTQPIKGTLARGKDSASDARNAELLQSSAKDRAENLMIVDLLRNDLSKNCHQVDVPALFALQSFANVHHLVSTVTARLNPGIDALQVLEDCFPGGSITGAPKIRAMEIIEELEPVRRSVYCGSLGYLSACGNMDTSIAIRTLVCDRGRIHCWGGGGIVSDSEIDKEYQESLAKVRLLMETLERQFMRAT